MAVIQAQSAARVRRPPGTGNGLTALVAMLMTICLPVAFALDAPNEPGASAGSPEAEREIDRKSSPPYATERLSGRVVRMAEALRRRGIEADEEPSWVALETPEGVLWPLMKDDRGRAFWLDDRLLALDWVLEVRRYREIEMVQVIRTFTRHEGRTYEFDYWCDICAIPMFQRKPCDCCQAETRFRERWVDDLTQEWVEPQAE